PPLCPCRGRGSRLGQRRIRGATAAPGHVPVRGSPHAATRSARAHGAPCRVDAAVEVKVYPDLREIRRYEITLRRGLAYDAGQRRARIPGAGSLFSRLRDYEPDDDPRSISWK